MNDIFSENNTNNLYEPRKLLPFKKGEGLLQRCIARFIQSKMEDDGTDNKNMEAFCSCIKPEEEKLFNDELFNMVFNPKYGRVEKLYGDLIEFSKSINKPASEVYDMLRELCRIRIMITDEVNGLPKSSSSIFTDTSIVNPVDSETAKRIEDKYYFLFEMNPLFLKACKEVKLEMDK